MKLPSLLALPLLLALAGCGAIKIRVPAYNVAPPASSDRFLAGVAKVDITPPPGYPMGGHSIGGRMARGYWTRLYARAFYFQDTNGRRLVLVSCDLFAIPAGLHAQVAQEMQLPPESLIVSATHTHHGPAGFMSSAVFNFGGPLPGYDGVLAGRLKDAIKEAIGQARADAAKGRAASVVLRSGTALNLQRNRAIDAFFLDPPAETRPVLDRAQAAGMTCPDAADENPCPRYQAADPALHVLEVLRDGRRIGLLVFFAIHNTAMSHDCTLYQADLSGYAMHLLEQDPAAPVVAGFFNGAEGDISPRWVMQDRHDVEWLGGRLAGAVNTVLRHAAEPQNSPAISAAANKFLASSIKELTPPGSGVGELGGAEDGRTMLYAYGWHGGFRENAGDVKMPAFDLHHVAPLRILQRIIGSPENYPREIPIAVASLGTLSLAAVPTEMTTVEGVRLRQALENGARRPYVVIGLANEYIGYTTTPEEYFAQNYEGASTMYGRNQGDVIRKLAAQVAAAPGHPSLSVKKAEYDAGGAFPYRFGPELFGERYNLSYEDLGPMMPDAQHRPDDSAPRFEWRESRDADWDTRHRSVNVLVQDAGGWILADDDEGGDILTVLVDARSGERTWTAIWAPPKSFDRSRSYLFLVEIPGKGHVCSQPFPLGRPVSKVPMDPVAPAPACPWRNP